MNESNWHWDMIYIINLDNHFDLYDKLKKHLNDRDIFNITRIKAVYGLEELPYGNNIINADSDKKGYYIKKMNEKLKKKNIIHKNVGISTRYLKPGEIGCTLSFRKVLSDAIKNNFNNILILEDDVNLVSNFEEKLNKSMKEVPKDWDIIYLGVSPYQFLDYKYIKKDIPKHTSENICKLYGVEYSITDKDSKWHILKKKKFNKGIIGTFAFMINKKSIKKIYDNILPIELPFDIFLGRLHTIHNELSSYYTCNNIIEVDMEKISTTQSLNKINNS